MWLSNTEANRFKDTYIKGFLDISGGDIINRNGGLYVAGDASFNSTMDKCAFVISNPVPQINLVPYTEQIWASYGSNLPFTGSGVGYARIRMAISGDGIFMVYRFYSSLIYRNIETEVETTICTTTTSGLDNFQEILLNDNGDTVCVGEFDANPSLHTDPKTTQVWEKQENGTWSKKYEFEACTCNMSYDGTVLISLLSNAYGLVWNMHKRTNGVWGANGTITQTAVYNQGGLRPALNANGTRVFIATYAYNSWNGRVYENTTSIAWSKTGSGDFSQNLDSLHHASTQSGSHLTVALSDDGSYMAIGDFGVSNHPIRIYSWPTGSNNWSGNLKKTLNHNISTSLCVGRDISFRGSTSTGFTLATLTSYGNSNFYIYVSDTNPANLTISAINQSSAGFPNTSAWNYGHIVISGARNRAICSNAVAGQMQVFSLNAENYSSSYEGSVQPVFSAKDNYMTSLVDVSFNKNLYVANDVRIDGNLTVYSNDAVINTTTTDYQLIVAEDLSLNGRMFVLEDASFNKKLYAQTIDTTTIGAQSAALSASTSSTNTTSGALTVAGGVGIVGNLHVGGDLRWDPNSSIADNSIPSSAIIGGVGSNSLVGRVDMDGDVSMNKTLTVDGDVSFNSNLIVNSNLTIDGSFDKKGLMQETLFVPNADANYSLVRDLDSYVGDFADQYSLKPKISDDGSRVLTFDQGNSNGLTEFKMIDPNTNTVVNTFTRTGGRFLKEWAAFMSMSADGKTVCATTGYDGTNGGRLHIWKQGTDNNWTLWTGTPYHGATSYEIICCAISKDGLTAAEWGKTTNKIIFYKYNGTTWNQYGNQITTTISSVSQGEFSEFGEWFVCKQALSLTTLYKNNGTTYTYVRNHTNVSDNYADNQGGRAFMSFSNDADTNGDYLYTTHAYQSTNTMIRIQNTANSTEIALYNPPDEGNISSAVIRGNPINGFYLAIAKRGSEKLYVYRNTGNWLTQSDWTLIADISTGLSGNDYMGINASRDCTKILIQGKNTMRNYNTINYTTTEGPRIEIGKTYEINAFVSSAIDVSFNKKLYVAGDVSMNNSLYVNNGLTVANGPISLPNNSIPASVINGAVTSNPTNFTGDVSMNSELQVLGDVSLNSDLYVNGIYHMAGHILPTSNADYDIGSAEYKVRHLFLSDNSLWVGDDHKIDVSGGHMKFKKRNKNRLPKSIEAAGGSIDDALAITGKPSLEDMNLHDWLIYGKTLNVKNQGIGNVDIRDIYDNNIDDYDNVQDSDITVNDLSLNQRLFVNGDVSFNNNLRVYGKTNLDSLTVGQSATIPFNTPPNSNAIGFPGQICVDTDYIYVCVANNTWKRSSLGTW